MTDAFLHEAGANEDVMAQLFSNFSSQRVVKPFVKPGSDSAQQKFGANALMTLKEARRLSHKAGSEADLFRRNVTVAGACGPISPNPVSCAIMYDEYHLNFYNINVMQISLRELARLSGCGNNHMRVANLFNAKHNAESIPELLGDDAVKGTRKTRKDKIHGDPIWTRAWHHFMALKKGQSFRCSIVKTQKIKDPTTTRKWVWQTKWARHQKRYMSMSMEEFHEAVKKWKPYLQWRATYLQNNPRLPSTWHVGISRLYKEKCFCIDQVEEIRKCGCEYHLKMGELVVALKKWRRGIRSKIKEDDAGHTCDVRTTFM